MEWKTSCGGQAPAGLGECIGDFQDLRGSILMGHREMLVHRNEGSRNEAEVLSYALAGGIPHFD